MSSPPERDGDAFTPFRLITMTISTPSPSNLEKPPEKLPDSPDQNTDYEADSNLRRMLSTRHITMIALGSSIGLGMWLGSGTSLRNGGPAAMLIGYLLAGSIVWSVNQAIGEMAVLYPIPSAFVQWASMFVCPSVGFAVGWVSWFGSFINIANELQVSLADFVMVKPADEEGCCDGAAFLDRQRADCGVGYHLLGRYSPGQCMDGQVLRRDRSYQLDHQIRVDVYRCDLVNRSDSPVSTMQP